MDQAPEPFVSRDRVSRKGFFRATALWVVALLVPTLAYHFLSGLLGIGLSPWRLLHTFFAVTALLIPFAAFGGGVAAATRLGPRGLSARGGLLALLSFALAAYAAPMAEYRAFTGTEAEREAIYPLGPNTPGTFLALREAVREAPPERIRLRVELPYEQPPNWITYRLHAPAALAAFGILAAVLGWLAALLTTNLSPLARPNARWAMGIGSGFLFIVAVSLGDAWILWDPSNSGLAAAWLPLLAPVTEMGVLYVLARRRLGPLRALPRAGIF